MNCKRLWDREILVQLLPKTFVNNDFKKHRENMLLERETAMMPATQTHVNQEIQRRKNVKLLTELQNERLKLKRKLAEINNACFHVQRNLNPPLETEKRTFIHRCSNNGCKGFLSTQWKCNICSKYTCSECNMLKGDERDTEHVCKEEDKETMKLLRAECKKCPSCAQYIYKLEGCDQMWCTSCHTAFSWRTGMIVNGTIHNPHYYEFQRNRGTIQRAIGDIPCGGMPTIRELQIALLSHNKTLKYEILLKLHRVILHIEHVELPRVAYAVHENNNVDLRVKFMMNEISTDNFKVKIQQREKAAQKKRDLGLIYNMFITTVSDYFREMIFEKTINPYFDHIKELILYTNNCLCTISKRYECIVNVITHDIKMVAVNHKTFSNIRPVNV